MLDKDEKIKELKKLVEEENQANYSLMDDKDIMKNKILLLQKLVFELVNVL